MWFKSKWFLLGLAVIFGIIVMLLPRPEGTRFKISGDADRILLQQIGNNFELVEDSKNPAGPYTVALRPSASVATPGLYLQNLAGKLNLKKVQIDYVDGLSPKAKRFLAVLVVLVFLFIAEPIPLEITAICIGVFIVVMGVGDVKDAWAPYMHPVVVFIMCCLIFAI
jgi:sodium-dependent dicarboxylate transporter 2/3/5